MKKLVLILSLTAAFLSADHWSGADYHKHSSEQRAAGEKLLNTFSLNGDEAVLDVGCGDGFLTSLIAEKVPSGSVVGIDLSPSMVSFASEQFGSEKLSFRVLDAKALDYENQFDMITSFTVLLWIPDQLPVLQGFRKALKEGGRMVVEMPNQMPPPMVKAIEAVTRKEEWKEYFVGFSTGQRFFGTTEYNNLLEEAGLKLVKMAQFTEKNTFPNRSAFAGFLKQWFPYLRAIPDGMKQSFIDEIVDSYLEFLPPDEEGRPSFYVRRLRCEARRP